MQAKILLDASSCRRWQIDLVRRLEEHSEATVSVEIVDAPPAPGHRKLEALLLLERRLHGLKPGGLERGGLSSLPQGDDRKNFDLVLDLTAEPAAGHWTVLYNDRPGEQSAVSALRAGRQPLVSVVDDTGTVRAQGRPGSEQPGLLATALADIGAGTATLVIGALTGSPFAAPASDGAAPGEPRPFSLITARRIVGAGLRLGYRAAFRAPHWRVGWRRSNGPDLLETGKLPDSGWHDLPDDGLHFYADPFLFEHDGAVYLLVEDFDHRAGKAVLSATRMEAGDFVDTPRQVLSHEVHLSYPCVFGHAGEIWMIPETSGAKTVELYRAVEFPWRWERHSILLEEVEASDATPFVHAGRWWLTATVGFGGSLSDSLCLWSAPEPWGPWTPHKNNPVLVDIASARPAGHVHLRDGRLLRPVQDCRAGYGAAMAVAEITRLDDEAFEQTVVARYSPGDSWPGTRLHTFNTAAGIETVDGSSFSPRFRRGRRG